MRRGTVYIVNYPAPVRKVCTLCNGTGKQDQLVYDGGRYVPGPPRECPHCGGCGDVLA